MVMGPHELFLENQYFTNNLSLLRSLSYGTIFSESVAKMLPRHGIESSVALFPEELWPKQGLGHLCTCWIMPKQLITKRRVDETSAENYPRGWLSSVKLSGRRLGKPSTPNRRVSQHTHPQDTIAIPHRWCWG